jgi:hypothetical protein
MPRRRHKVDSTEASYQKFAESLLINIAAMTPVPQEQDFGNRLLLRAGVSLTVTTERRYGDGANASGVFWNFKRSLTT